MIHRSKLSANHNVEKVAYRYESDETNCTLLISIWPLPHARITFQIDPLGPPSAPSPRRIRTKGREGTHVTRKLALPHNKRVRSVISPLLLYDCRARRSGHSGRSASAGKIRANRCARLRRRMETSPRRSHLQR
jgi:hypothetical protein